MIWADSEVFHPQPHLLPANSIEIILDLPAPPSTNRLWRHKLGGQGGIKVYKSKEYVAWMKEAGLTLMANRQFPKDRITGPFEICVYLANSCRGDLDNHLKGLLDWLQPEIGRKAIGRVGVIANDKDCQKVYMERVPTAEAPLGCRVHLRSLHNASK